MVEQGSPSMRESLLPQLAGDLAAYLAMEEQVFYPAACAALHEMAWLTSGKSWQTRARQSLDRVLDTPVDGDDFARAVGELRSAVELHAEEGEAVLFPRLESVLDAGAMRRLGLSMMALYDAKQESGHVVADRYSPMPMRAAPPVARH